MYTDQDLIDFGNFLLQENNTRKVNEVTESVINAWKKSHAVSVKKSKHDERYVQYNIEKAHNGGLIFLEHKGHDIPQRWALAILEAALENGYRLIEDIPDEFVDEVLDGLKLK